MYYEVRITIDYTVIANFEDKDDAIAYAWDMIHDEGAYNLEVKEIEADDRG